MEIREIKNQKEWNNFITSQNLSQFLQSWEWGVFQESLNRKIRRLAIDNDQNEKYAIAQVVKMKLPFGFNYLYIPRGPIIKNPKSDPPVGGRNPNSGKNWELFFKAIAELARKEKSVFFRFELPIIENCKLSAKGGSASGGKIENSRRVADVQPSKTIILDLLKSEEELLTAMHPKTRYNIRLAQKHGVKIKTSSSVSDQDISTFLNLLKITSSRDSFRAHPADYYRQMLKVLASDNQVTTSDKFFIRLYQAEYQGKILAANLIGFFGDTVTYLHGASSDESRQVMAPYLLQWQVILDAKKQGCRYYDFWGIDEKLWPGVTRFKMGFGGKQIKFLGAYDYIINPLVYRLYRLAKKFI